MPLPFDVATIVSFIITADIPLVFLLLLFTFVSAWLIPCFLYGYQFYLPILNMSDAFGHHDDYFYYARLQKIMHGEIFCSDPLVLEFSSRPHTHCSNQFSYLLGSLPGFFTKNIITIFILNNTIFPALLLVAVFCLSLPIAGSMAAALVCTALFLWGSEEYSLHRFPTNQVTALHILLLGAFCLSYFSPDFGGWKALLFLLGIGFAPVINAANAIYAALLVLCTIIIDPALAFQYWAFFLGAGLLGLTTGLYSLRHMKTATQLFQFAHFDAPQTAWRVIGCAIRRDALPLCLLLPLYAFLDGPYAKALFCVIAAAVLTFALSTIFLRQLSLAERCISRGFGPLTLCMGYATGMALVNLLTPETGMTADLVQLAMALAALAIAWRLARLEFIRNKVNAFVKFQPMRKELVDWASSLQSADVILTLDFDLGVNLPVYTPAHFYVPQLIQSTATEDEVWLRFMSACAFLNISPSVFAHFMKNLPPTAGPYARQAPSLANAARMLTYGKYYDRWNLPRTLTEEEAVQYVQRFFKLQKDPRKLVAKATILVVSKRQELAAGIYDRLLEEGLPPLFRNEQYAAFFINEQLFKVLRHEPQF